MSRRLLLLAMPLLAILLAIPGCPAGQTLAYEKTVNLEPGDVKSFSIDAPKANQKIRVETEGAERIDVTVTLESEAEKVKTFLEGKMGGSNPPWLARKTEAKQHTLEAEVPAGKGFTVILSGANKKTEVKLKVKSI